LLLTDAWFDICTSAPGLDRMLAAGEAIFAELPLAGAGIWLAVTVTRKGRWGTPDLARRGAVRKYFFNVGVGTLRPAGG
jgi:hypothetical protein